MSNVGKNVFEITRFGSVYCRGEVVSETDKTFSCRHLGQVQRVFKGDGIVTSPLSEEAGTAAFRAVSGLYAPKISAAEKALADVREARRTAILTALKTTE